MSGRILIIDALSAGSGQRRSSRDSIGCGPRSVAGVFEKYHIDCKIYRVEDALSKKALLKQYDHLAISAMTMDLVAVRNLIKQWHKGKSKSGKVVIGGSVASDPFILRNLSADVLVVGEGEATLEELISIEFFHDSPDLENIKGIAYEESGQIKVTPQREFISSASLSKDYIPSTTRIVDYNAYQASKVYVEVTRGCSNYRRTTYRLPDGRQCSDCGNCDSTDADTRLECPENIPPGCGFCSVPSTWGPPRSRSIDIIVKEVKELLDLGVHRIILESPGFLDFMRGSEPLTDPCSPPANLDAIRALLHQLNSLPQVQNNTAHIAIENMKACLFNADVARVLAESTICSSPNIGLETGSEFHMHSIGKCGTPTDVLNAVRTAVNFGLRPFVYFIYGLPGEDRDTTNKSIRMMHALSEAGAERIILYGFKSLPGSAFDGFPDSSASSRFGLWLRREVERINHRKKMKYLGLVVRGIAAEPSMTHPGYTMVYPLDEGPIMTIQGGFSPGSLVNVEIQKVLSDGLVEGKVVPDNQ